MSAPLSQETHRCQTPLSLAEREVVSETLARTRPGIGSAPVGEVSPCVSSVLAH